MQDLIINFITILANLTFRGNGTPSSPIKNAYSPLFQSVSHQFQRLQRQNPGLWNMRDNFSPKQNSQKLTEYLTPIMSKIKIYDLSLQYSNFIISPFSPSQMPQLRSRFQHQILHSSLCSPDCSPVALSRYRLAVLVGNMANCRGSICRKDIANRQGGQAFDKKGKKGWNRCGFGDTGVGSNSLRGKKYVKYNQ